MLVFIDNDILVERDFLRRHLDVLERNPGCWVIGRIVHPPELRTTPFGRYRDFRWEEFHRVEGVRGLTVTTGMSAANLALPAEDFRRFGGFDEAFSIASCEDFELGLRARQAGVRVLYDPDNVVVHNDWAVTLPAFCERQRLYSISDVLLYRKYGEASPRTLMVRENGVGSAPLPRIKRGIKRVLATGAGRRVLQGFCRVLERLVPDSRYTRYAYDLAVAVAIFRGVREGIRRYPVPEEDMHAA